VPVQAGTQSTAGQCSQTCVYLFLGVLDASQSGQSALAEALETQKRALSCLLLYRREVSENTMLNYADIQGDPAGDVYALPSNHPRARSSMLKVEREQEHGRFKTVFCLPMIKEQSHPLQVRGARRQLLSTCCMQGSAAAYAHASA
jgi:hypothetical protein